MNEAYVIFYQSAMVVSLLTSVFLITMVWQRRQFPGAKALIALLISTFVWTAGFLCEANSNNLNGQLLFNNVGYLGSMSVPVEWFIFAWQYTNGGRHLKLWSLFSLFGIPLIVTGLIWTNEWHHLMWYNEHLAYSGLFLVTVKTYGPFFWLALTYNYILIITGSVLLIRNLFVGPALYIGQMISLITAVSLPLIWNVVYVFNLVPLPRKELTPAAFAMSGVAIVLGLMRFRLFTAVPFARQFIIEQLGDGIIVFNSHNRLLEINPAAMKIIGENNNIIGKELKNLLLVSPVFRQLFSARTGRLEFLLTVSNESRFYEMEITQMCDKQGIQMGRLVTLHDITESKKMQQHLMVQDRLASIGQFTSGVTHEINNALTPVLGFTEMLLGRDLKEDDRADLLIIRDSAQQAAGVISRLLTFARQGELLKEDSDIGEILDSVVQFRYYLLEKEGITVTRDYQTGLPKMFGNSIQLRQVFLNLIVNAEYAINQSGEKDGDITIKAEKTGEKLTISIKDNGSGISEANMDKLFTPFFTTKKAGDGTGLGLSICYGIVTEHQGKIWAESVEGEGATFIVELPILLH